MKKRRLSFGKIFCFLGLFFIAAAAVRLNAEAEETTEISTAQELLSIKDNPAGNYILTADIDMQGVTWQPFAFFGTLDGQGHAILNLTVEDAGEERRTAYDGNMKTYDACFSGMFSVLENARVENLVLLGERVEIYSDEECFVGAVAGYSDNSVITGCRIEAEVSLRTRGSIFGVGGVVGFGNGAVTESDVKVTLICVDLDAEHRDEQFMGGVFADGYVDTDQVSVEIAGYVSEHGYAHNGGIAGMYMFYPEGLDYYGYMTKNTVKGFIRFFEDNTDRRAYCAPYAGEIVSWNFNKAENSDDFLRDEVFEYDRVLLPEQCESPDYTLEIMEAEPESFGYTVYTCQGCGYSYHRDYRIYQEEPSSVMETTETEAAETEAAETEAEETKAGEAGTKESETEDIQTEENTEGTEEEESRFPVIFAAVAVAAALGLAVCFLAAKKRK